MLEWIRHIDQNLLHFIHVTGENMFLDQVLPFFRNPYFWSPVYLFLLVFMWKHHGKKGLWWCVFFIATFVFCDFVSASLIKPLIQRLRPCNDASLYFTIRSLVKCGSGYSFPSAHAANHVGFAMFMIMTLRQRYKSVFPLALVWAFLVCYAQLYVCVHYPSDILGGAVLGSLFGAFFTMLFHRRFGRIS